jgi:hypothetical protein
MRFLFREDFSPRKSNFREAQLQAFCLIVSVIEADFARLLFTSNALLCFLFLWQQNYHLHPEILSSVERALAEGRRSGRRDY